MAEEISGRRVEYEYSERSREGDHICYISDLSKAQAHYPDWSVTVDLVDIFEEIHGAWTERLAV
jgi:CDP-paratose 2-epimerase